jgi:hypothetical protein
MNPVPLRRVRWIGTFESRPAARDQIVRLCTNPMLLGEEIIMAETTYNPAQSHRAAIV